MTSRREKRVDSDVKRGGSVRWTSEETRLLELSLMKYGIGQWTTILNTGLLPGKAIIQLNNQTQRLLGQQSLAVFSGLCLDVPSIRSDNAARTDVTRKAGVIINTGGKLCQKEIEKQRKAVLVKYGLTSKQKQSVEEELDRRSSQLSQPSSHLDRLLRADVGNMKRKHKIALLHDLRSEIKRRSLSDGTGSSMRIARIGFTASNPSVAIPKIRSARYRRRKIDATVDDVDENPLDPSAVEQLMSMGYSDRHAMDALTETHNDVEAAVRWLLLNCS